MRRLIVLEVSVAAALFTCASAASPAAGHAQGRWVIRDLGTFGQSFSDAVAINDRGQVVCNAWVGDDGPIAVSPPRVNHAFVWQNGKSTKLTLGGKQSGVGHEYISDGQAAAINERGQVVGWAETKAKDEDGDPISHAFLWENGTMRDLGTLGGEESEAVAINAHGQVVGQSDTKSGETHAFQWENGKMIDLGAGDVVGINNLGQVVVQPFVGTAFISTRGRKHTVGTSKHPFNAAAINDRGQVVGTVIRKAQGKRYARAFIWENGKMRDVGALPGKKESIPADINDRGQVVGWSDAYGHAFLWQNGKMRDLGTLPGEGDSSAKAINERGQIVGGGFGRPPFVWQNGKMTALPRPGRRDANAVAISERGQIIGYTEDHSCYNECPRALLWTLKP